MRASTICEMRCIACVFGLLFDLVNACGVNLLCFDPAGDDVAFAPEQWVLRCTRLSVRVVLLLRERQVLWLC